MTKTEFNQFVRAGIAAAALRKIMQNKLRPKYKDGKITNLSYEVAISVLPTSYKKRLAEFHLIAFPIRVQRHKATLKQPPTPRQSEITRRAKIQANIRLAKNTKPQHPNYAIDGGTIIYDTRTADGGRRTADEIMQITQPRAVRDAARNKRKIYRIGDLFFIQKSNRRQPTEHSLLNENRPKPYHTLQTDAHLIVRHDHHYPDLRLPTAAGEKYAEFCARHTDEIIREFPAAP